jgi:hypothetical protein
MENLTMSTYPPVPRDKARIRDADGQEWLHILEAARHIGRCTGTLENWKKRGIVATKRFRGHFGYKTDYFGKADLDRLKADLRRRPPVSTYPGLVLKHDALSELNVSDTEFYRLLEKHKEKTFRQRGASGAPLLQTYVRAEFIQKVKAARGAAEPLDTLTVAQAALHLGLSRGSVYHFVYQGQLRRLAGGKKRVGIRLSRAAVEALRKKRDEQENVALDLPGRWQDSEQLTSKYKLRRVRICELLRHWVKAGKLSYRIGYRWRPKSRKRHFIRLYDADKVAVLMVERSAQPKVPVGWKSASTLARDCKISETTFTRLLGEWSRSGELCAEVDYGVYKLPLRKPTRLFDPNKIVTLLAHRRAGEPIAATPALQAANSEPDERERPSVSKAIGPVPIGGDGASTDRHPGRRVTPLMNDVQRLCFEGYTSPKPLAAIRAYVATIHPNAAPKHKGHVATYAKRYAERKARQGNTEPLQKYKAWRAFRQGKGAEPQQ